MTAEWVSTRSTRVMDVIVSKQGEANDASVHDIGRDPTQYSYLQERPEIVTEFPLFRSAGLEKGKRVSTSGCSR